MKAMRTYAEVQKDFRDAFADLAKECEGFVGHSQTFRSWFGLVVSRFGLENLDVAMAGFRIMFHTDLSFSKDIDLAPRFIEFMATLKRIDNLEKELEAFMVQGIKPEVLTVTP